MCLTFQNIIFKMFFLLQKKWTIKLDHKAEIFQNLNGAVG